MTIPLIHWMFYAGMRVKCLDATGAEPFVRAGLYYRVQEVIPPSTGGVGNWRLKLTGIDRLLRADRFVSLSMADVNDLGPHGTRVLGG